MGTDGNTADIIRDSRIKVRLALATLRTAERIISKIAEHFEDNESLTKAQFASICVRALLPEEEQH